MEVQQQQKVVKKSRSHLLRHELPNVDLEEAFGTTDGREIAKDIARWGQKELQVRRSALMPHQPSKAWQFSFVQLTIVCACRRSSRWSTERRRSPTTTTGCGANSWKVRLVAGIIRKYQLAGLCAKHGVLSPSNGMRNPYLFACRGVRPMPKSR